MTALDRRLFERPFAHRGLHDTNEGRPENSRAAFEAAIAAGYAIEMDLQLSGDDQALVFHDYDLDRLTPEQGPVRARSAAELTAIPLLHGSETLPTLEATLTAVAGRTPLLIEFKDQDGGLGPDTGKLEAAAAPLINAYEGPLMVMSFNPLSMTALQRLCPDIPRGLTTCAFDAESWPDIPAPTRERLAGIPDAAHVGASFVSHDARDLSNPRLAALRNEGLALFTWTVRSAEQAAAALRIVDQITFEGFRP